MNDGEAMERGLTYEPWVAYGMDELQYFKMRHLEQSRRIEELEQGSRILYGALEDAIDFAGITIEPLGDNHQRLAAWLRGVRDMVDADRSRVEFKQEYKGEWAENTDAPKQVRESGDDAREVFTIPLERIDKGRFVERRGKAWMIVEVPLTADLITERIKKLARRQWDKERATSSDPPYELPCDWLSHIADYAHDRA